MPKTDYEYISMFNPDGIMDVSNSPAQGRDEMYTLRAQMDDGPVMKVQHHVNSLFMLPNTLQDGKTEVIFHGSIVTHLKNDQQFSTDYASWVKMSPSQAGNGELKADYWKAFIDRSAFAEAIGKMSAE